MDREAVLKPKPHMKEAGSNNGDVAMTFRKFGLMTLFAAWLLALPTASHAFSSEAQQMCTGDAFRLCSSEIPDVSRITACMMKQRASLSEGCRAVMERDLARRSSSKVATQ